MLLEGITKDFIYTYLYLSLFEAFNLKINTPLSALQEAYMQSRIVHAITADSL
jgi:hypothetical protein